MEYRRQPRVAGRPDRPRPADRLHRPPLLRLAVGAVLRRIRLLQGRTLLDVARAAGVSVPYLSEVERGRKEPSSEVLAAICRALGVRLTDLLDQVRDELIRLDPAPARPPGGHARRAAGHARVVARLTAGHARVPAGHARVPTETTRHRREPSRPHRVAAHARGWPPPAILATHAVVTLAVRRTNCR